MTLQTAQQNKPEAPADTQERAIAPSSGFLPEETPVSSWMSSSLQFNSDCPPSKEDELNEGCIYLKDTWRVDAFDRKAEDEVYEEPQRVRVAPFGRAGGLEYSTTAQHPYMEERSCTRESTGITGAMDTFRSPKDLVRGVLGALAAHRAAFDVAKMLHLRDICSGNIMLTNDDLPARVGVECDSQPAEPAHC
ncbi:hypothetical protein F5I97DRAFT_1905649 [Phlebopus sp. FC_14]|nr:hypothetical protein F5I97DRAFT_1905649 [Phlebopus sp. FC_14]